MNDNDSKPRQPMEDGGKRMQYEGGAKREPTTGKGRYDLISPFALARVIGLAIGHDKEPYPHIQNSLDKVFLLINEYRKQTPSEYDLLAWGAYYAMDALALDARNEIEPGGVVKDRRGEDKWFRCIDPGALKRLAKWYELGAAKYTERNWESGMSYTRCLDASVRHANRWLDGERGEDHLAAVVWNLFAVMHYEMTGLTQFNDLPKYNAKYVANGASQQFHSITPKVVIEAGTIQSGGICLHKDGITVKAVNDIPATRPIDNEGTDVTVDEALCFRATQKDGLYPMKYPDSFVQTKRGWRRKVIAVDFDGCLCQNAWPGIGEPNTEVIKELNRLWLGGARLILWTCREYDLLEEAIDWCDERGLKFEAINENLPHISKMFGGDSRKIYADEYWDDKAVHVGGR